MVDAVVHNGLLFEESGHSLPSRRTQTNARNITACVIFRISAVPDQFIRVVAFDLAVFASGNFKLLIAKQVVS